MLFLLAISDLNLSRKLELEPEDSHACWEYKNICPGTVQTFWISLGLHFNLQPPTSKYQSTYMVGP